MKLRIAIIALVLLVLAVGGGIAALGMKTPSPSPVPAGHASVHLVFEDLSTDQYNQLFEFARTLAAENSRQLEAADKTVPALTNSEGFHGLFNDGFIDQQYEPAHELPNANVEKAMRDKLDKFLKSKSIDADNVTLELRGGS